MTQKQHEYSVLYVLIFIVVTLLHIGVAILLLDSFGHHYEMLYSILLFSAISAGVVGYFFIQNLLHPQFRQNLKLKTMLEEHIHELNVPLSTIQTNAGMLKKLETDPKAERRLERILLASRKLYAQYERMEYEITSEIFVMEKELFCLNDIITDTITAFEDRAEIVLEGDFEITIRTERYGFGRMLDNLFENAIKYGGESPQISITFSEQTLAIRDNGEGMDEITLLRVFDRYFQGKNSPSGMGLGLDMVKRYCQENSIAISIDSQKGEGTTFSLNLSKIREGVSHREKKISS